MATPPGELLGKSDAEMNAELDDYAAMGVDWVRMDIQWYNIETSPGAYDWSVFDKLVDGIESRGMKVVGVLGDPPAWIDGDMSAAADREAFASFTAEAVARYDGIDHWEVGNEPNKAGITPEDYTELLKLAHAEIKANDASDTVITGGTAAVPFTQQGYYGAVEYLERMYAAGAKDHFDAVGYHPYTYPLFPSDDENWNGWEIMEDGIRPTMVANGDENKQVWMTELGAPTWGAGDRVSEADQARILSESVEIAQGYDWAGPIMWYSYEDRGGDNDTESWFGLVREDGSKKDGYWTYSELANNDNVDPLVQVSPEKPDREVDAPDDAVDSASARQIEGTSGDDVIDGGSGDDVIAGASGNDRLTGGEGADRFVFDNDMGWDRITDFEDGDLIDLRSVDAVRAQTGDQAFAFVGGDWLSDAGDLGAYQNRAARTTHVEGDVDGDGVRDFSILLDGLHQLEASDFLL